MAYVHLTDAELATIIAALEGRPDAGRLSSILKAHCAPTTAAERAMYDAATAVCDDDLAPVPVLESGAVEIVDDGEDDNLFSGWVLCWRWINATLEV